MLGRTWPSSDARLAVAGQPRRLDEARLAPHIGLGAGDAGIEREVDDGGGDHDVDHLVAERRHDAHGQHEQREGHDGVGEAADDAVGPAAEIARGHARQGAQHEGQDHRGEGDREIEPGRHQHAAEDVAAELVGAEPVRRRGRLQRHGGIALQADCRAPAPGPGSPPAGTARTGRRPAPSPGSPTARSGRGAAAASLLGARHSSGASFFALIAPMSGTGVPRSQQ